MDTQLPFYLALAFGVVTLAAYLIYLLIIKKSTYLSPTGKTVAYIILFIWLALQGILGVNKIYSTNLDSFPPKLFLLGIFPVIAAIIILMITKSGKAFVDSLPLREITYLNTVRVGVELVLLGLFLHRAVPKIMTFEGGNFDILSGLSAPLIAYLVFTKKKLKRGALLLWNFICLGLLINVVTKALLSAPFPLQKLAFDQPNFGILIFPFVWLPTFIVPVVLFGHLIAIRRLIVHRDAPTI